MDENQIREIYERKFIKPSIATAQELIDTLRLSNPIWKTNPDDDNEWYRKWYFRGQADAVKWDLTPTAWRTNPTSPAVEQGHRNLKDRGIDRLIEQLKMDDEANERIKLLDIDRLRYVVEQIITELMLVRDFIALADQVGHRLPVSKIPRVDTQLMFDVLRDLVFQPENGIHRTIWNDPAVALAQHHGIPCRLLDWSFSPLVAAYFAAIDALTVKPTPDYFAVYAIHSFHLNSQNVIDVSVRNSENEFLRAQQGIFVLDTTADEYYLKNGRYPDLMRSLFTIGAMPTAYQPYKFVLPISQAEELIRLLYLERVTKAHLMPSLDNVALSIKDKWRFVIGGQDGM